MELYIVRHGVAEDYALDGSGDAGRRLTKEGIHKMEQAAQGMVKLGIEVDVILTSPLVRAYQTAEIMGAALGVKPMIEKRIASGCTLHDVQEVLLDVRDKARVMLVGHEPDLSSVIGGLTGGSSVEMRKGALALVHLMHNLRGGELLYLLPSRVLRGLA